MALSMIQPDLDPPGREVAIRPPPDSFPSREELGVGPWFPNCMRGNERVLSVDTRTPALRPSPPRGQRLSVGRVRVDLHRFRVPKHAKKPKALHEPSEVPPGFGLRQSSGAFGQLASIAKAPED